MRPGGSGSFQTDRTFTGQKSDGTGLHFYNARYYDSALGVFLSPDTLVPDAGAVVDYNRFLYVRGNPLKFVDPSGHIAICFQGAPGSGEANAEDAIMRICAGLAKNDFFEGDWFRFNNTLPQIWTAYYRVREAKQKNPTEAVAVLGYSYGGGAALELARLLNEDPKLLGEEPIHVDTLITIEPVSVARGAWRTFGWATSEVPSNVGRALNLWAGETKESIPPGHFHPSQNFAIPAPFLNGMENVKGALNVEIAGRDSEITNHFSIIYPEIEGDVEKGYNRRTDTTIRTFMSGRLWTQ